MIHIAPSFHYDVAYLKSYDEYLPDCFRNIDEALRLMERHPEYCFLLEQILLIDEYWQRFPEKRPLLKRFAREGRLDVAPGMWVMPDMNHCDGESLFVQCQLGKRWLQDNLQIDPKVCWIADCWGHHAQLPQILRACGYDYYVFWRCMRRDVLRNDFLWQGIDGTRIPTHWLARGYSNVRFPAAGEIHNVLELNLTGCDVPDVQRLVSVLQQYEGHEADPAAARHPNQDLLICNGGDMTFPQASAPGVLERLNQSQKLPSLQFSTPSRFLETVSWENKPVVNGEFNSAFQGTFTQNIRIKQLNRTLCNRLFALERLAVILDRPIETATADAIWKLLLKQQFHDIICGSITDRALDDCYREFAEATRQLEDAQRLLGNGSKRCYFNPLPWRRIARSAEDEILDLPAMGFGYPENTADRSEANGQLPCNFKNDFYSASISISGYIDGLIEANTGFQLVREIGDAFGGLGLQVDNGDPWLNFEGPISGGSLESSLTQNAPDPWDRSIPDEIVNRATFRAVQLQADVIRHSPDELIIRQRGMLQFWRVHVEFETIVRMSRFTPRVEYRTTIKPSGKHFRIRVGFPCAIQKPRIRNDIPFGIQTREAGEHVAQCWAGLDDGRVGLALVNAGTPSSNGCDGVLMLTLFRSAAMEYKTKSEKSFLDGEPHTFHYAIVPHAADEKSVIRQAAEFNFPPMALHLDATPSLVNWVFPESIRLSALRHESNGVLLRIYDGLGVGTRGTIQVPTRFTSVVTVDGIGRPRGESRPISGSLDVTLTPFEIQSFRLS